MAGPPTNRRTLNVQRAAQPSHLAEQLLAAVYELITPLLRRTLPRELPHEPPADEPQPHSYAHAGGRQG